MAIGVQQFPILSPDQMSPTGNLFQNALQKFTSGINAAYLPKEKAAALQQSIAEALIKHAQSQVAPQMEQAKLATEQAQPNYLQSSAAQNFANANRTNTMTPLDAAKQSILNKFLPQHEQADINETNQRGKYYGMGGAGMGVGDKSELFFQRLVGQDNPHLNNDPAKIYEASNVLRSGGNQLSDGTPIYISPASRDSYDRVSRGGTTAKLVTSGVQANQSDAEIQKIAQYTQPALKPYAETFAGYSPKQIQDSFSTKEEDQKRLGRFIAAQQLQYEIAQNEIKLAQGEPGVTSTQELMKLGQQLIKARYPHLSASAREESQRYFLEALREGLKARQSVPIGAGSVRGGSNMSSETPQETRVVNGNKVVKIDGKWYHAD